MKRKKNLYLRRRMLAIFLAAIMCFGEFGVTAFAEGSSETPETTVDNSSNAEDVEDTDDTEDVEDTESTENTDDTEDVEDAENTEDTYNTEDVENVDDAENTDNTEDVENTDDVNNVDNVENTDNVDNVDNVNNIENVDNTNNVENVDNADQQTGYATREELEAAYNAVVGLIDSEDKSALNDAIDNYVSVYNRLSPEDQAEAKEQYDYVVSLRPVDTDNESGREEDDTYSASEELKETAVSDVSVLRAAAPAASTVQKAARASKASYKGTVTLYGTPEAAIKKGPTYGSKVKIDLGTRTGQSWNNVSYTIPKVSDYFTLNDGWTIDYVSVAGNSSGNRQPGGSFLLGMSGGSMVYYFKQTAVSKTFTLNYNANGGSGAPARQTAKSTASSHNFTISSTEPTRSNYKFLGWSTSSGATTPSYYSGRTINVTGTTTLYAVWQRNADKVTLTYDANGGSNPPAAETVDKGTDVIIKGQESMSYGDREFLGWSTKKDATEADWAPGDTMKLNANTTLYAVWKEKVPPKEKVTLTYDANNGINPPAAQTVYKGTDVTIVEGNVARDGYTFLGWSTDKNATEADWAAGDTMRLNADTTLYAVWQNNTEQVTLTYDANGGSNPPDSQTEDKGTEVTIKGKENMTYEDYTFLGWSISNTADKAGYNPDDKITLNADMTLYAVWQKNAEQVTLTYDANGGSNPPDSQTEDKGTEVTIKGKENMTYEDYTFLGWSISDTADKAGYNLDDKITLNADMTLYAVWQKNAEKVTLTYDANGGSNPPDSQTEDKGTEVTIKDKGSMTYGDREFLGWSTDKDATTEDEAWKVGKEVPLNANTILYAVWKEKDPPKEKVTLTYDANGGSNPPNGQTVDKGAEVTIEDKGSMTYGDREFLGWSTDKDATAEDEAWKVGEEVRLNANTTLYAVWKEKDPPKEKVTLTYDANGGSNPPNGQTVDKGAEVTIEDKGSMTYGDREFLGWSTDKDATTEDEAWKVGKEVPLNADTTLFAVWQKNDNNTTSYRILREYRINGRTVDTIDEGERDGSIGSEIDGQTIASGNAGWVNYGGHTFVFSGSNPGTLTLGEDKNLNVISLIYAYNDTNENPNPDPNPNPNPDPNPPSDPTPPERRDDTTGQDPDEDQPTTIANIEVGLTAPAAPVVNRVIELVEIPNEEVPLANLPRTAEEGLTDIFDEEVPLSNVPKTGDNFLTWLFCALGSAAGLVLLALKSKKRKGTEA